MTDPVQQSDEQVPSAEEESNVTTEQQAPPEFTLFSSDGVGIPEEGITFTFTRREGTPEEYVQSLTLHDTLRGLNLKPNAEGNSQASTFASFALQMDGISTEEDIIKRWPDAGIQSDGTSRAWRLIGTMRSEVEARRQAKAASTMRENRTMISQGQVDNMLRLKPQLLGQTPVNGEIKGGPEWQSLVNQMSECYTNETENAPAGAEMSLLIAKAYRVLGIQRQRSTQVTGPRVSDGGEVEEPF